MKYAFLLLSLAVTLASCETPEPENDLFEAHQVGPDLFTVNFLADSLTSAQIAEKYGVSLHLLSNPFWKDHFDSLVSTTGWGSHLKPETKPIETVVWRVKLFYCDGLTTSLATIEVTGPKAHETPTDADINNGGAVPEFAGNLNVCRVEALRSSDTDPALRKYLKK